MKVTSPAMARRDAAADGDTRREGRGAHVGAPGHAPRPRSAIHAECPIDSGAACRETMWWRVGGVRKTLCRPRSLANFSLWWRYSRSSAFASCHLLGQPRPIPPFSLLPGTARSPLPRSPPPCMHSRASRLPRVGRRDPADQSRRRAALRAPAGPRLPRRLGAPRWPHENHRVGPQSGPTVRLE
jgi:hypothetical protein